MTEKERIKETEKKKETSWIWGNRVSQEFMKKKRLNLENEYLSLFGHRHKGLTDRDENKAVYTTAPVAGGG